MDRANVGMLLDTWHFCAGGSRPEELSALRGDRLFMVHVSDCPARAPFTAQRAESYWPGEGDAPLEELLRSVRATGYDGPCSVEVMDPNVLALPAVPETLQAGSHLGDKYRVYDPEGKFLGISTLRENTLYPEKVIR